MESRAPLYALCTSFSSSPSSPPPDRSLSFPIEDLEDVVKDDGLHSSAISSLLPTGESNTEDVTTNPNLPRGNPVESISILQVLSTAIDMTIDKKTKSLLLCVCLFRDFEVFTRFICALLERFGLKNKECVWWGGVGFDFSYIYEICS